MYKPKILLLVDYPNWAFDHIAHAIVRRLKHRFDFSIKYFALGQRLDPSKADMIHVFAWGGGYHERFGFKREQIIKEVASLRWMYEDEFGRLNPQEFASRYLDDCACVVTPSLEIFDLLSKHSSNVLHMPNGVDISLFRPPVERKSDRLTIGWVGNPRDSSKGLHDILIPAAGKHKLMFSDGQMSRSQLSRFYRQIDVLAIASVAEGQPLPLLESMASGCFPITTNVGIVPELVSSGKNGLIVPRDIASFKNAFDWSAEHLERIRTAGLANRLIAYDRSWERCAERVAEVYLNVYERQVKRFSSAISPVHLFPPRRNDLCISDRNIAWVVDYPSTVLEFFSRLWLGSPFSPGVYGFLRRVIVVLYKAVVRNKRKVVTYIMRAGD